MNDKKLAEMLRAGESACLNLFHEEHYHEEGKRLFYGVSCVLGAMAASLEQQPPAEPQVVRKEKQPGDVVIGSVCTHEWVEDLAEQKLRCRKCREVHEQGCPATLVPPGVCDCGPRV